MKMRHALIALSILMGSATPVAAQVSVSISVPGVSIGIHQPAYPELVLVPGYPVYYAPRLNANYFFYDGMYWVYYGGNWYASSWYNGPWGLVDPYHVPLFVLRVPVRYYRAPPVYFREWRADAPPRWGHHWGPQWEQRRRDWDRWDRRAVPPPAPPPTYQRQYSGDRYPRPEQQRELHNQHYRYQPREVVVRERFQEQPAPREAAPARGRTQGEAPGTRAQSSQRERDDAQRRAPTQAVPQERGPALQEQRQPSRQGAGPREQQAPRSQGQDKGPPGKGVPQNNGARDDAKSRSGPAQGKGQEREKGQGRQ
jgi:hypothetical protein